MTRNSDLNQPHFAEYCEYIRLLFKGDIMDLDKVRKDSCKHSSIYGHFNSEESIYESNLYIGDCIRELTNELKKINKNLGKISENTEKQSLKCNYANIPLSHKVKDLFDSHRIIG